MRAAFPIRGWATGALACWLVAAPLRAQLTEPLPPTAGAPLPAVAGTVDAATGHLPPGAYPIDLATALRLADACNYRIALARERTAQAWARADLAAGLWLPSLRAGMSYNRHEGALQDVEGHVLDASRDAYYAGAGAGASGTGSPAVPGLQLNFHLADALFEPLAARQAACAQQFAAAATTNDVLLNVALGYLELLRASVEVAISQKVEAEAQQLAGVTRAYAATGQGLLADADRAAAEVALRRNDTLRAVEHQRVASARLAQQLRLDPGLPLLPLDPSMVPVEFVAPHTPPGDLVAQALGARPELAQDRALVAQAVQRMRREQFAVLMPSVALGTSYGSFGGRPGGAPSNGGDRFDLDAMAYWELRNLGLHNAAARREAQSLVQQAHLNRLATMDQIAREVAEAHIQLTSRLQQISIAQEGVASALESHQLNWQRIRNAQGLPIEVLQSNQALALARREYLRALNDYNAAQLTLCRALGWPARPGAE